MCYRRRVKIVGYKETQRKKYKKVGKKGEEAIVTEGREGKEQTLEIQILIQHAVNVYGTPVLWDSVTTPDVSLVQWRYVEFVTGGRESLLNHLLDGYH